MSDYRTGEEVFPYTIEYLFGGIWRPSGRTVTLESARHFCSDTQLPVRIWMRGELLWESKGGAA